MVPRKMQRGFRKPGTILTDVGCPPHLYCHVRISETSVGLSGCTQESHADLRRQYEGGSCAAVSAQPGAMLFTHSLANFCTCPLRHSHSPACVGGLLPCHGILAVANFRTPHVDRLEIFVGFASFTSCLVAVDKLYLYYATVWRLGSAQRSVDVQHCSV